jgi:hypothetical protein
LVTERTQNIEEKIKEEVTAQKARRVAYLQSLIEE